MSVFICMSVFLFRLLHVQNANCKYNEADQTCQIARQTMEELQALGLPVNSAAFYTECCALLFAECQYDEVRTPSLIIVRLMKCMPLILSVPCGKCDRTFANYKTFYLLRYFRKKLAYFSFFSYQAIKFCSKAVKALSKNLPSKVRIPPDQLFRFQGNKCIDEITFLC